MYNDNRMTLTKMTMTEATTNATAIKKQQLNCKNNNDSDGNDRNDDNNDNDDVGANLFSELFEQTSLIFVLQKDLKSFFVQKSAQICLKVFRKLSTEEEDNNLFRCDPCSVLIYSNDTWN